MPPLLQRYADLIVNFGANVQEGQIVDLASALGKEDLTRAITASAYKRGAKFVDVYYWDPHLKRERVQHVADEALDFVPAWYGERTLQLGDETADGIWHMSNLPTEEVFTTPDPERVEGVVRATMPLYLQGLIIEGLTVRFEGGHAVQVEASAGADVIRALIERNEGGDRLGELALVDREGRIGAR